MNPSWERSDKVGSAPPLSHCHRNIGIILISKLVLQLFYLGNSYLQKQQCKRALGLNNLAMYKDGEKNVEGGLGEKLYVVV